MANDNRISLLDLQVQSGCTISPFVWRTKYALAHKGFDIDIVPGGFTGIKERTGGRSERCPVIVDDGAQAVDAWRQLVQDSPRLPGYRLNLARALNNRAATLERSVPRDAERGYREAREILTGLHGLMARKGSAQAKLDQGKWHAVYLGEKANAYQSLLEKLTEDEDAAPPEEGDIFARIGARQQGMVARAVVQAEHLIGGSGMQAYCLECPAPQVASAPSRKTSAWLRWLMGSGL